MKKSALRTGGFSLALVIHATIIIMLSITAVNMLVQPPPPVVPEPMRIEIGEQITEPPETTMEEEALTPPEVPPVGKPEEESMDLDIPSELKDEAMLKDPHESPPEEITEKSSQGLPGERVVEPSPTLLKKIIQGPESKGVPTLFGQPIKGNTVFLVDLSGSMDYTYMLSTRFEIVLAKLINAIRLLDDSDKFDIIAYSGAMPAWESYTDRLYGALLEATDKNKEEAVTWLRNLQPAGNTPTYEALRYVCTYYTIEVENLVLITDGVPDMGTEDIILNSIKKLMSHFDKCLLICISIGDDGLAFVKRLVHRVGGVYVLADL